MPIRRGGMSMELSDRIKRPKARAGMAAAPSDRGSIGPGDGANPGAPPDSFDSWLDGRLQALYRTVLNEPLPTEILELLSRPKEGR